ncbi:bromodomain-containing protein [Ditylenchus destructor]|uniref:Bromodomain-containing protein n=1 Tax=Ditylenchus destructor TaxID=166010 RepID=A0AAD4NG74_9BILA|nr:bromodomain-containing protein [Ditylenchus destructor]
MVFQSLDDRRNSSSFAHFFGMTTRGAGRRNEAAEPALEERLEAVLASLLTLTDNQNRLLCPPFRVLDSRENFPIYYDHIKNPIDMKMIAQNIRDEKYTTWAAFEADIKLMCKNAKAFNEPGSTIYKDASRLQTHCSAKREEFMMRKFTAKEIAHHKELIDELLRQEEASGGYDEFSEDSEEDEDSENDKDPKWVLYWTIRNFEVVDGHPLCEQFLELPSKNYYPDYYDEIQKPMSLFMINKRLKQSSYKDLVELVEDLRMVFRNACTYNLEDSDIYKAAVQLEQITLDTAESLEAGIRAKLPKYSEEKEEANTSKEDIEAPKSKAKPARKVVKRQRMASEENSTEDTQRESSTESNPKPPPFKRRTARAPPQSTSPPPMKEMSPMKSELREKQKPGRKSMEELRQMYTGKLMEVWNAVHELKIGNRLLSEPFQYLPCEKTFPDYYTTIENPMDLTTIRTKIDEGKYADSNEMLTDISLMCNNARQYNRPNSQIFTDSSILESVATSTLNSLTENNIIYYPFRKRDKNWTENAATSK